MNQDDITVSPMNSSDNGGNLNEKPINTRKWLNRISKAKKKNARWREKAKKCFEIYRDEGDSTTTGTNTARGGDGRSTFNILWANIETLLPALFSQVPNPDVRSRYLTQDPSTEDAARVLERCLMYSLDNFEFPKVMKSCVKDYLITGRGVTRSRLIPEFEDQINHDLDLEEPEAFDEDGDPQPIMKKVLIGQYVVDEIVPWDKFNHTPCERWEDVWWESFEHLLDKDEFEDFFPDAPLISATKVISDDGFEDEKYQVYEIWDKKAKKVYYIGDADEALKVQDDPFRLEHFWPNPRPIYSIETSTSLVPIPEYLIYEEQSIELNEICYRITDLVKTCKSLGVYDALQGDMKSFLTGPDSQFIPVATNLLRERGIHGIVDMLDVSPIAKVLAQLYEQREKCKEIIYEVTGISDIIRGQSAASETATAQNIKASYAGLRLRDRKDNINRYIVEMLRIKAELIATFFTPDQMSKMSGIQITPEILSILKDDIMRCYRIDIEADSTVLADMQQLTQQRAGLIQGIVTFLQGIGPMVMNGAVPMESAKALLKFALQPAKLTREVEDAIDKIGSQPPPQQPVQPGQPQTGQLPGGMPPQQPRPPIPPQMHPNMNHHLGIPHGGLGRHMPMAMPQVPGNAPGMQAVNELMGGQPQQ